MGENKNDHKVIEHPTSVQAVKKTFEKESTIGSGCLKEKRGMVALLVRMSDKHRRCYKTYFAKPAAVAAGIQQVANILSLSGEDVRTSG